MNQYHFKRSFSLDTNLSDRLFDLLETTRWGVAADDSRRFCSYWQAVYAATFSALLIMGLDTL